MSTSQAMLGNAGTPYTLEHNGRTYAISRLTRDAKNAFSTWLIQQRRMIIVALYGHDQAQLAAQLKALTDEALDGVYDFHEEEATKAMQTNGGVLALVAILCNCPEEDVMVLMAERRTELLHLLDLVIGESVPGYRAGQPESADPNAQPAAQARRRDRPAPSVLP